MTTGCVEYWFMLHFKMYAPPLQTVAEKERVISELLEKEPGYKKGDYPSTARIAENYPTAMIHAKSTMHNLLPDGLPGMEDTDERNQWLCKHCYSFSNVYEALKFLQNRNNT